MAFCNSADLGRDFKDHKKPEQECVMCVLVKLIQAEIFKIGLFCTAMEIYSDYQPHANKELVYYST